MKSPTLRLLPLLLVICLFSSCTRQEPALTGPPPVTVLPVTINEVFSRGDTLNLDWIELYNPNTSSITIGGYALYDAGGKTGAKPKKTIPAGTAIHAFGYFVISVDTSDASGFGLSSSGETVWLENASGAIIDSCAFPALGVDTSYARVPDGTNNWAKITLPTRGATNSSGGPVQPIVMNEIYSRGVPAEPDWIELYNPNSAPVTIGGYKMYDAGGNSGTKPKLEIPAGTTIPAKGYVVITTDITTEAWGFGLSSAGEEVWLENSAAVVIDHIVFPAMGTTQSYGRYPDGGATLQLLNVITKGAVNQP